MKRFLTIISVILGLGCLVVAYIYWMTPANALPPFFPGYDPSLSGIHVKHGLAALILGLALLVFGWFMSGKKKDGVPPAQPPIAK